MRLWHPVTWACVRELVGHCGAVLSLAVCDDYLWSGSRDCAIKARRPPDAIAPSF